MERKVVVFFIGGAGDKMPYFPMAPVHHVLRDGVKVPFDEAIFHEQYHSLYLDFREVFKEGIEANVLPHIRKENCMIHIVGHSLGGWNGAYLAQILGEQGYQVDTLVTLDPVGESPFVKLTYVYRNHPKPICDTWINVLANPPSVEVDDFIAWSGVKWIPLDDGVQFFHTAAVHHREVGEMFTEMIADFSAFEYVAQRTRLYLTEQPPIL